MHMSDCGLQFSFFTVGHHYRGNELPNGHGPLLLGFHVMTETLANFVLTQITLDKTVYTLLCKSACQFESEGLTVAANES